MQLIRKTVLGLALGAAALTAASPAMADGWRGHRGGGDTTGAAIAGGIVGLAVGAAIASNRDDRDYRDDRYYYDDDYRPHRVYYYYRDYPRPYYRNNYRGGWDNRGRGHEWREHRGYYGHGGYYGGHRDRGW